MNENKQWILQNLCDTLRTTSAAGPLGSKNPLVALRYVTDGDMEFAVPIFEDGSGEPNEHWPYGYYGVNITGDSGIAIIMDVVNNFVRMVW